MAPEFALELILPLLLMVALPAVLEFRKLMNEKLSLFMVALPPLMTMPAPLKVRTKAFFVNV